MRRALIAEAEPGQILARPVLNINGEILLKPGTDLSPAHIEALRRKGYTSIPIEDPQTRGIEVPDAIPQGVRLQAIKKIAETFDALGTVTKAVQGATPETVWQQGQQRSIVSTGRKKNVEDTLLPLVSSLMEKAMSLQVLDGLHNLIIHDKMAFNHSVSVCVVALKIGQAIGLPIDRLRQLALGCLLVDIGKVFVPREILNKKGKLSPAERIRVSAHTTLGYRLLRSSASSEVLAHHIAWQHHERQDGTGYPRKLTGTNRILQTKEDKFRPDRILQIAEVAAVADFYVAITSDRPQRPAMPPDRVPSTLTEVAGSALNREIVSKFLAVLPLFPTGTEVIITSGEHHGCRAVVMLADQPHLRRPKIRAIVDAEGAQMDPVDIDLLENEAINIITVRQAMLARSVA